MTRYYSSTAVDTTLAIGIDNAATSMTVASTSGFPTSYPFTLAVGYDTSSEELVDVTAATGLVLTITRNVDSTPAVAHSAGSVVKHVISARDMRDAQNHYNATTSVHGITDTSALTTASNTQTFTNKSLTSPAINGGTLSGSITNSSTITGGTISGSTLSGTTTNSGTISGGTVSGATLSNTTTNSGTISGGTVSGATLSGTTTATSGTIALGTNASAITANSTTISATELGYLDGVTSAIQTQLDGKAASTVGTWSTWTGLTVSGGVSAIGNGTLTARYTAINKTIHFELQFTVGTTTTFGSTAITFNLPTSAESTESPNWMAGNLLVGSNYYGLNCRLTSGALVPYVLNVATSTGPWVALTPTNMATLASGSIITINGTYEAA